MNRLLVVLGLLLVLGFSIPEAKAKDTPESLPGVNVVSPDLVKQWMDNGDDFLLIDARKSSDYEDGHLPEAERCPVNTDVGLGDAVIRKAVVFLQSCESLEDWPKDGKIVAYCNAHT